MNERERIKTFLKKGRGRVSREHHAMPVRSLFEGVRKTIVGILGKTEKIRVDVAEHAYGYVILQPQEFSRVPRDPL